MKKLIGLTFMVALTMESSLRAEHRLCIEHGVNRFANCKKACESLGGMLKVLAGGDQQLGKEKDYDDCMMRQVKSVLCICRS